MNAHEKKNHIHTRSVICVEKLQDEQDVGKKIELETIDYTTM